MNIIIFIIGWFAGIGLGAWLLPTWWQCALTGLFGGLILFIHRQSSIWLPLGLCLLGVGLGAIRFTLALPNIDESHIAFYNDQGEVSLTGIVIAEPDVRDRFVNLRLQAEQVVLPDETAVSISGTVLVRTFRYPEVPYGARVRVNGRLETPPENPDFSYRDFLARKGIHSLIALPRLEIIAEEQASPIYQAIFALKARARAAINHAIPEPAAALLTGILLGDDNGLPPDLADDFRLTGMTHIIAISGFNIAILITILASLADPFLPRQGVVAFAIGGIVLYTILVGAEASVVRAAVMGSLYLVGTRLLGRPNFAYASLFFAGFVMTLVNPNTLWDVGFQLSFTATLGLMLYADPLTRWTRERLLHWFDRSWVRHIMGVLEEAVLLTLTAQVLTLPLMIYYFDQVSLISLLANALILPAQGGVMLWGGLTTLVGLIFPALSQLLGFVAWLFLAYTIWMVRVLAAVPFAAVSVSLSAAGLIVLYAFIGGLTWLSKQKQERRTRITAVLRQNLSQRLALGGSMMTAVLVFGWGATQPDGNLHLAFLDVGQGDATFIQTPSGRQILIDGGFYPSVLNDQLSRQMPFWDRTLDLIIATHPDADHVSALVGVFERYRVTTLITDGEGFGESPIYDAVLEAANANGAEIRPALAGEVIQIEDGVRLEVLHPSDTLNEESRNENSVSMRLVYGDFTYLFTGDAEQEGERQMLTSGRPLSSLVYKAGHHGSNSSSSAEFLAAVQPQIVIVSAGADNRFGHPAPDMLQRVQAVGAAVLRTDQLGTITMTTDGKQMWWWGEKRP